MEYLKANFQQWFWEKLVGRCHFLPQNWIAGLTFVVCYKEVFIQNLQIRSEISRAVSSGASQIFLQVTASWKDEDNRAWGVCCDLSEQLPVETVLDRVERSRVTKSETLKIVRKKLDPDDECAMTSLRVSLQCPVGQSRMKMPTRTRKCNHLQVGFSFYPTHLQGCIKTYSL